MPNLVFFIFRACLVVPLGLGVQVVQAVGGSANASTSARTSGLMSVSVQVVATCTASITSSTQLGAGDAASCQDRTPFVLSHAVRLSQMAPGAQVLTIRY
jgi:hypothetical protein